MRGGASPAYSAAPKSQAWDTGSFSKEAKGPPPPQKYAKNRKNLLHISEEMGAPRILCKICTDLKGGGAWGLKSEIAPWSSKHFQ